MLWAKFRWELPSPGSCCHGNWVSSSEDLEDLLLTSWCQKPHHTFKGAEVSVLGGMGLR